MALQKPLIMEQEQPVASHGKLCRRIILVVEDEFAQAQEMEELLHDDGAVVLGPAASIDEGMILCRDVQDLDAAILDVNLAGRMVYPLAEQLMAHSVPFIFATGYDTSSIPDKFAHVVRCEKPIEARQIVQALSRILHV